MRGIHTRIEERIEEKQKITRNLFKHMKKSEGKKIRVLLKVLKGRISVLVLRNDSTFYNLKP